mmetsp:Transcript_97812/g.314845  ORF Transcript_97812/g.314845 Transcript_97812/m.314845 type:complete len:89 (-) Transcript_97812:58-324(-)
MFRAMAPAIAGRLSTSSLAAARRLRWSGMACTAWRRPEVLLEVEALGEEINGDDSIIDQVVHTSVPKQSGPHSTWARVGSLFEGSTGI